MIRKQSSPSLEADMSLGSSQTDPSAAQWNSFAARVSKQAAAKDPFSKSPVTSPNHSTTVRHSQQRPLPANNVHLSNHYQNHKIHRPIPATGDLSNTGHHLFSEHPLCFCQKLASRSESGEYGVIYDCHYFSASSNKNICGFHVHQQAWQKMGAVIKKKQIVDDPELHSCPYFNFTYCVVFRTTNTSKKSSPLSPRCFCNKRARMFEIDHNSKHRIYFACPSSSSESSHGSKCNWFVWAEELAFVRPKEPHHNSVLPLLMKHESSPTSPPQVANIPRQLLDATTAATAAPKNREQHSLCLLTALTSTKLDSLQLSEYDRPKASTAEDQGDHTGEKGTMGQQKSLDELLYGSQHPYSITTTTTTDADNSKNSGNNRFIPTSVRRSTLTKVQEDDSYQQQEAAFNKAVIVTPNAPSDNEHQLRTLINALQERGMEREQHVNDLQTKLVFMQREMDHQKDVSEKQQRQLQMAIDTETSLRQHSEKQLASIEHALEIIMEENSTLFKELESRQSFSVVPREPKCQVCFSADVECAVVPCFHSGESRSPIILGLKTLLSVLISLTLLYSVLSVLCSQTEGMCYL